jgi:hypothetical protein
MPVIACPKCQGKLKLPDNMEPRRVKCPNCAAVFMSNEAPQATGAAPPPAAKPKPAAGASDSKAPRRGGAEKDFDFDDDEDDRRPRARRQADDEDEDRPRRRRRDEDDDEEERPRARRRDDDEEDDRPRRRRRDEDDEDEDRPRARRRREQDDDEEEDRPRRYRRDEDDYEDPRAAKKRKRAELNRVELGAFLSFIAGWLYVAALGVTVLTVIIVWSAAANPFGGGGGSAETFSLIAGLLGLGHLLTAAVGIGFYVTGPKMNRGLAIATAVLAGLYIVFAILILTGSAGRGGGFHVGGQRSTDWSGTITSMQNLPMLMVTLTGPGLAGAAFPAIPLLAGLVEIARNILHFLFLKSTAEATKDYRAGGACKAWVITFACVVGGLTVLGLILGLVLKGSGPSGLDILMIFVILIYAALAGVLSWGTLIIGNVRQALRYR